MSTATLHLMLLLLIYKLKKKKTTAYPVFAILHFKPDWFIDFNKCDNDDTFGVAADKETACEIT